MGKLRIAGVIVLVVLTCVFVFVNFDHYAYRQILLLIFSSMIMLCVECIWKINFVVLSANLLVSLFFAHPLVWLFVSALMSAATIIVCIHVRKPASKSLLVKLVLLSFMNIAVAASGVDMLVFPVLLLNIVVFGYGRLQLRKARQSRECVTVVKAPPEYPDPSVVQDLAEREAPCLADEPDCTYGVGLRIRLETYFLEEKPFLDPSLSINDVAAALYTNKTYVSRVINSELGMNFNQFVNKYRVEYAIKSMQDDPNIKMFEVSQMCGFRSMSTFSMAFRSNVGEAPGEWCRKHVKTS